MGGRVITALIAQRLGWRNAFLLLGLITGLCGVLAWVVLPRSRRFTRQRNLLAPFHSMLVHLRNRRLLATYAVGFISLFSLVGTFTYVNFYLAAKPFSLGLAALGSVFLVYGLGLVVTPMAGLLIDRYGYRAGMIAAVAMAIVGLLLTLLPVAWAVVVGLAIRSPPPSTTRGTSAKTCRRI